MSWSRWRLLPLAGSLATAFAAVVLWLSTDNDELLLVLLPVVVQWAMSFPVTGPGAAGRTADRTADATTRIRQFWEDEARRRRENTVDLNTLPVRWHRASVAGRVRDRVPTDGDGNELVRLYAREPFRLLLLGEPGAGKTALCVQFVQQLLRDPPAADAPVPVLLQLASWNRVASFDQWVVEQLRTLHGIGRRAAQELLDQRRILPILDGLDEGPDQSLAGTLRHLQDSALVRDRPFVIACRDRAWDDAEADHLLDRDAEIRILPLAADQVVEILHEAFRDRPGWRPVVDRLRAEPGHPLAAALTTRLMVYLLVRVYTRSERPPAALLDDPDLTTAERIRRHLIGAYLHDALDDAQRGRFPDAARRDRWLRYAATDLCRTTDLRLSWWRFFEVVAGSFAFFVVRVGAGALLTGALCVALFGAFGHALLGLGFGAVLGGIGGVALSVPPQADPRALPLALRNDEGPWPSVIAGLVSGVGGAVAIGILYHSVLVGAPVGLAIGLGLGLGRRMLTARSAHDRRVLGPDDLLRDDRWTVFRAFGLGGAVTGFIGAGLGLVGRARAAGLVIGVTTRWEEALVGAGIAALCGAVTLAMMVQATGAWGRFLLTKVILAQRGDAPWRLMTFLRAAEQAGILRRLGPQYEFRSELFRQYLIEVAGTFR